MILALNRSQYFKRIMLPSFIHIFSFIQWWVSNSDPQACQAMAPPQSHTPSSPSVIIIHLFIKQIFLSNLLGTRPALVIGNKNMSKTPTASINGKINTKQRDVIKQ